jgi:hypothetical protein
LDVFAGDFVVLPVVLPLAAGLAFTADFAAPAVAFEADALVLAVAVFPAAVLLFAAGFLAGFFAVGFDTFGAATGTGSPSCAGERPILNSLPPQTGQVPLVAGEPFSI